MQMKHNRVAHSPNYRKPGNRSLEAICVPAPGVEQGQPFGAAASGRAFIAESSHRAVERKSMCKFILCALRGILHWK